MPDECSTDADYCVCRRQREGGYESGRAADQPSASHRLRTWVANTNVLVPEAVIRNSLTPLGWASSWSGESPACRLTRYGPTP